MVFSLACLDPLHLPTMNHIYLTLLMSLYNLFLRYTGFTFLLRSDHLTTCIHFESFLLSWGKMEYSSGC